MPQGLPSSTRKVYEELEKIMNPSKNMQAYRQAVAAAQAPLIPFFRTGSARALPRRALV